MAGSVIPAQTRDRLRRRYKATVPSEEAQRFFASSPPSPELTGGGARGNDKKALCKEADLRRNWIWPGKGAWKIDWKIETPEMPDAATFLGRIGSSASACY
jgi:hypothetical protein